LCQTVEARGTDRTARVPRARDGPTERICWPGKPGPRRSPGRGRSTVSERRNITQTAEMRGREEWRVGGVPVRPTGGVLIVKVRKWRGPPTGDFMCEQPAHRP